MEKYTDKQRKLIAEEEYEDYDIGELIKIGGGKSKTPIGYVSEIKDSSSELQVYVVTDIKLPEQPTAADYEKVTHVTLLYRGSTGFNEIVDKPVDVLADWVVNDIPMAIRTTVPDAIPRILVIEMFYFQYSVKSQYFIV